MASLTLSQFLAYSATSAAITGAGMLIDSAMQEDPQDVEGQRTDGINLQTAQEGAPILRCFGPRNRVAPTIFWISEPTEAVNVEEFGGKGSLVGPDPATQTTYRYDVDVAIGLCEARGNTPPDQVQAIVPRVWVDGRQLGTPSVEIQLEGDMFEVETLGPDLGLLNALNPYELLGAGRMVIKSPANGPDLTQFYGGVQLQCTGFANAGNNGSHHCTAVGSLTDGGTFAQCRNIWATEEPRGASVILNQINLVIANYLYTSLNIRGGPEGVVDPVMLGQNGNLATSSQSAADITPAYRHIWWLMIQGLHITPYGNRVPQLTFDLIAHSSITVGEVIASILSRAGLTADEYDVSRVSGDVSGYTLKGPTTISTALTPLLRAFDIVAQQSSGKLTFFHRGDEYEWTVNEQELAASEEGQDIPRPFSTADVSDHSLPREVRVQYFDVSNNLQRGSQHERRINEESSDVVRSVEIPLSLTAGEARGIASRELWRAWIERQRITMRLPPSYAGIQEYDIVSVTVDDAPYRILVMEVNWGANYVLEVKGVIDSGEVFPTTGPADDPVTNLDRPYVPPALLSTVIDHAPLQSAHINTPGLYYAASRSYAGASWAGAALYVSEDDTEFTQVVSVPSESTIGIASTMLADGPVGIWDRKNTVDIEVKSGTLENVPEENVLRGENIAILGDEIIGYANATLISTGVYRLSMLLRGLRDTADQTNAHTTTGDRFIPLSTTNIGFVSIEPALIGQVGYYKFVANGGDVDNYPSQEYTPEDGTRKPFAPVHVTKTLDGSNNAWIYWERVSRDLIEIFPGLTEVPLIEDTETYEVDIYLSDVVVRTLYSATGQRQLTYAAVLQEIDGLTPGDPIDLCVYQMDSRGNRGRGRRVTI